MNWQWVIVIAIIVGGVLISEAIEEWGKNKRAQRKDGE